MLLFYSEVFCLYMNILYLHLPNYWLLALLLFLIFLLASDIPTFVSSMRDCNCHVSIVIMHCLRFLFWCIVPRQIFQCYVFLVLDFVYLAFIAPAHSILLSRFVATCQCSFSPPLCSYCRPPRMAITVSVVVVTASCQNNWEADWHFSKNTFFSMEASQMCKRKMLLYMIGV